MRYAQDVLYIATFQEEAEYGGRIMGRTYFTSATTTDELANAFPKVSNEGFTALLYWLDENGVPQYGVPDTIPNGDITFYLHWNAGGDTPYTVQHYLQNADGTYPAQPYLTENKSGVTNAMVEVTRPEGLDAAEYGTGTYETTTIAADGSTVVRVEYPRQTYTLTFDLNVPENDPVQPSFADGVSAAVQVRWGAALPLLSTSDVRREGYGLTGWTSQNGGTKYDNSSTMPTENLTVYAQWEGGIAYTVEHYRQTAEVDASSGWKDDPDWNLDLIYKDSPSYYDDELPKGYVFVPDSEGSSTGSIYILYKTENLTADEGTTVVTPGVDDSNDGFELPDVQEVNLEDNGSTVVQYFYPRKTYSLTVQDEGHSEQKAVNLTVRYGTDLTGLELMRGYTASEPYTSNGQPYDPVTAPYQGTVTLTPTWEGVKYEVEINTEGHEEFLNAMEKTPGVVDVSYNSGSRDHIFTIQYGQDATLPTGTSLEALLDSWDKEVLTPGESFDSLYLRGLSILLF